MRVGGAAACPYNFFAAKMSYSEAWLWAFLLTIAIEVPIVVGLTRGSSLAWPKRGAVAVVGQVMTHPLVWFVFPAMPGITGRTGLTLSELWAWLAEAMLYGLTGVAPTVLQAIGVSAIANALSLGVGSLLLRG